MGIAFIIVNVLIAIGMIAYAFVESEEVEYHADNDLCTKMAQNQTPTETCYRRGKKKNYSVFIGYGLGLLGILLAPTVRCLCDFVDELCQPRGQSLGQSHQRSIFELFKSCFSGISWGAISVIFLIVTIVCVLGLLAKESFKLGDLLYILGGIGLYALVPYLLNLNAESEFNLSRHLEEKGLYPAYTIAWSYYFNYLKKALLIFSETFYESDTQVQDQGSDRDPKRQLSLKKMFLLFPNNGEMKKNVVEQSGDFKKITDISEGGYNFSVYGLTDNGKEYKIVIQFAEEVCSTLRMMCIDERVKSIHEGDREDQVNLLYQALESEILSKDDECRNNCILVQKMAENSRSNGWLADLIMHNIRVDKYPSISKTKKPDISPTPIRKTVPPWETDDTRSDPTYSPCSSHTVDYFIPVDNPDENNALIRFEEEQGNTLERDKEPSNPNLQILRRETDDTSDLPCSSTLNVEDVEGKVRSKKQGNFIPTEDPYESNPLLQFEDEHENRLERDKEPSNPNLQLRKRQRKRSKSFELPRLTIDYMGIRSAHIRRSEK